MYRRLAEMTVLKAERESGSVTDVPVRGLRGPAGAATSPKIRTYLSGPAAARDKAEAADAPTRATETPKP